MNNIEKKVDDMARQLAHSLKNGSINSVLIEYIKTLEAQLSEANEKLNNTNKK
ncbi:hypothetical protein [Paraglaciecola sp. 2405UD69-4]|uniref:hypothetical protein n=1 Tax=Paraglaciecola sp. 2405UD69-4 TaxID=3391836 RepID=UPI0039C9B775